MNRLFAYVASHTHKAFAVAARRSERRSHENMSGKFLQHYNSVTAQHKNCPSNAFDHRLGRDLFRVLKFSTARTWSSTNLFLLEGKEQHDRTPTKIASALEFFCFSHYGERLARLKQVPIFKVLVRPGRDSTSADLCPTRR